MNTVKGSINGLTRDLGAFGSKANQQGLALAGAFHRGEISAKQLEQGLKRLEMQAAPLSERYKHFRGQLAGVGTEMLKIGAAGAAIGVAGKQVYNLSRSGAELQYTQTRFDRLNISMGTTSEIMMGRLRQATKGTVSDMMLARQGADLFQLGLARTADEAVRLSRIQTALGMDTGELTLALANQSKRRLDQLGLSLSAFNKIEKDLKRAGLSKEDAFREAFMLTAEETIATTGNRADANFGSFLRLEASAANLFDDMKMAMGEKFAPSAENVGMFLSGYRDLMSGDRVFDPAAMFRDMFGGTDEMWVRQAGLMDFATYANRPTMGVGPAFRGSGRGAVDGGGRTLVTNQAELMQRYYQGGGMGYGGVTAVSEGAAPAGPAFTPEQYAGFLSGGMQISQTTEQLSQATAELNAQLSEQTRKLEELRQAGYAPTTDNIREQVAVIGDLKAQIQDISQAGVESTNNLMMANIAAAASEEEKAQKQLEYALATGQITQEAYTQQAALMGIADAFAGGEISADKAAAAAQRVMDMLQMLDGLEVSAVINLAINGVLPAFMGGMTSAGGVADQVVQGVTGSGNVISSAAGGGNLSPITIVGDAPGGGWTPYTEVVIGNQVFPNKVARRMRDAGMLRGAVNRPLGGEIATDYGEIFYMGGFGGNKITAGNTGNVYTPGGGGGGSSSTATDIAVEVVDIIASPLMQSVQSAATSAQMQFITTATANLQKQSEMLMVMKSLLGKTASEGGIARAVIGQGNKWNG